MAVLTVPKILREKLTEEGAEALVVLLDAVESHAHDTTLETVEEKFERRLTEVMAGLEIKIAEVKSEVASLRGEVKSEMGLLRAELRGEFDSKTAELRGEFDSKTAEVKADMASFKSELIKWMFLFWIGQSAVVLAIVKLVR